MSRHHGGDGGDELLRHPLTIQGDCESAPPPKRRQHSKSLTAFQLFNKLGDCIPIQFDLEGLIFYVVSQYSEHYVWRICSLIRQQILPCYRCWKNVIEELRVSLLSQVEVK